MPLDYHSELTLTLSVTKVFGLVKDETIVKYLLATSALVCDG